MSNLSKLATVLKGGSGSGNYGHSGRPGKRGGSGGGKGGGSSVSSGTIGELKKQSPALYKALDDVVTADAITLTPSMRKKIPGAAKAAAFYEGKTIGDVISKADVKKEAGSLWDARDDRDWESYNKYPALDWAAQGSGTYKDALHKKAPGGSDFGSLMDEVFNAAQF